ncbi:MAG TPA: MarR family winged helix-turn-helix transcriptional regulator [Acidobacteriaceae bacterium]|nr:MarR family winged helix-turn-helix transcriptional regulator [Acidobacteriaceae bacterium]
MGHPSIPALPCLCATFRRAARLVSQRYDAALSPTGLTITQFTLLQALSLTGEVSQGRLGEILAMDSTTLTHTLDIIRRHGWIERRVGADRRQRRISLSPAGKAQFERAVPLWQQAQTELRALLGEQRSTNLMNLVHQATSAVAEQESLP